MKRLAKIAFLIVTLLAAVSTIIIGITQTEMFRSWLRGVIVRAAADGMNGALSFGDIHGNLVTGVRIDSVRLVLDGVTVFRSNAVVARYNPLRLPSDYIALAEVTISDPHLVLTRGAHDTSWNFERIIKPSPTPAGPFNWTIDGRDIEIHNASIEVLDSAAQPTTPQHLSFTRVEVQRINLSAACKISRVVQDVTINHFSFEEPVTGFRLRDLAGSIFHAADTSRFVLGRVVTNHSGFSIDAGVGKIDSTAAGEGLAKFSRVPLSLVLNGDSLSFDEAKLFSPALAPAARSVAVTVNVRGTLSKLLIKNFGVKFDRTFLTMSGLVEHLETPERISGDLQVSRSQIIPREVASHVPGVAFPDLTSLGTVTISQMTLKGNAKNFASKFSLGTAAGNASGTAMLNLTDSIPRINADVTAGNLNLSSIDATLPATGINGHVVLNGAGKKLSTFLGDVKLDLTASHIAGRNVDHLSARANINGCGITIDTVYAALADSGGTLALYGTVHTCDGIAYDLHLATEDLNVAAVTKDEKRTRITAELDILGRGLNLDSLVVDPMVIRASASELYGRHFPAFNATVKIVHPERGKTMTSIISDMGEVTLTGTYRIDRAIDRIVGLGNDVAIIVANRIVPAFAPNGTIPSPDTVLHPPPVPVDFGYHILVTNPALISAFLETKLAGRSTIDGVVRADVSGAHQTLEAMFGGFTLQKDSVDMQIGKAHVGFAIDRLFTLATVALPPDSVVVPHRAKKFVAPEPKHERRIAKVHESLRLDCSADSLRVNGLRLSNPLARFAMDGDNGSFGASAAFPNGQRISFAAAGALHFSPGQCEVQLDTVRFNKADNIRWHEAEPGAVTFNHGGITVNHLVLTGDSALVRIAGQYARGNFSSMTCIATHVSIPDLKKYVSLDVFNGLVGKIDTLVVMADGSKDNPQIAVSRFHASNIAFHGNRFGTLDASLMGADKNVMGEIHLGDPAFGTTGGPDSAVHRLDIDVRAFPFDCALASVEHRIPEGGITDVRTRAKAFPITFLELLFGQTVDQLRGNATGKIAISGNTPAVRYNGSLSLADVKFRAISTSIVYAASADILVYNDTLEITSAQVTNRPEELNNSWARVWGNLYFRGLTFDSYDLYFNADQLLVLSNASQRPSSTVYGPLVISTLARERRVEVMTPNPDDALHFFGTVESPTLEGTIYTEFSNLIFPNANRVDDVGNFAVTYDVSSIYKAARASDQREGTLESIAKTLEVTSGGGLLDRMRYNLKIKTDIPLHASMDFGDFEKLQDLKLAGELKFIRGYDSRPHLSGILNITGGTYMFYDAFSINPNSSMTFIDSIENPSMSISATTPPRLHISGDNKTTEYVQLVVDISGTRQTPIVTIHLLRGPSSNNLTEDTRNPDKNRADAIMFLATQHFSDDFKEQAGSASQSPWGVLGGGYTALNTTLSSGLSSLLAQSGLSNVNLQINKDTLTQSSLNVSTQLIPKIQFSVGGKGGFEKWSNIEGSVSFSLGDVLNFHPLDQTHVQFDTRATQSNGTVASNPIYSVRVGLKDALNGVINIFKMSPPKKPADTTHIEAPGDRSK